MRIEQKTSKNVDFLTIDVIVFVRIRKKHRSIQDKDVDLLKRCLTVLIQVEQISLNSIARIERNLLNLYKYSEAY